MTQDQKAPPRRPEDEPAEYRPIATMFGLVTEYPALVSAAPGSFAVFRDGEEARRLVPVLMWFLFRFPMEPPTVEGRGAHLHIGALIESGGRIVAAHLQDGFEGLRGPDHVRLARKES